MADRTSPQNPGGWILGIAIWVLLAWSAMHPPAISNEPPSTDRPPPVSGQRQPAVTAEGSGLGVQGSGSERDGDRKDSGAVSLPGVGKGIRFGTHVSTLPGFDVQEIYRVPRDRQGSWVGGEDWELIGNGFRNAYDMAFNADGELFTFDADMEWDIGAPWYRPTRICHVTSGAEFGWRSGTGKWPAYYPDSLPAVVDIGLGSPTGVVFGTDARFPAKYQQALFVCDWSYGLIYAVHLEPKGASYQGTFERFASAAPLPATDIVVNPVDGALYFTVGGRRAQSALYRVKYVGDASTDSQNVSLNSKTPTPNPSPEDGGGGPRISADSPADGGGGLRISADSPEWQDRALVEQDASRSIHAMIALARCGTQELLPAILERLNRIAWNALDESGKLELLRACQLAMARFGKPDPSSAAQVIEHLDGHYPSGSQSIDFELSRMLIYLEAPHVVARSLRLMAAVPTQQAQIHYALALRSLKTGWTLDQRREYLAWFHQAASHRGGMSLSGFLEMIRADAIDSMADAERDALAAEINNVPRPAEPDAVYAQRPIVKEWSLDELLPSVSEPLAGHDFENGRQMFSVALCFRCHRVRGIGDTVGPDLTGVGGRYNARDLFSSVLEPNKVISDQYAQTTFVVNGKLITGRVVNLSRDTIHVLTDMLDQSKLTEINVHDIEERFLSTTSMMPQGLLNTLTKDEISDLVAYLRSGGDASHPYFQTWRRLPADDGAGMTADLRQDAATTLSAADGATLAVDLRQDAAATERRQDAAATERRQDAAATVPAVAAATLARAHAHNDYRHKRPLLDALAEGFRSVEADIHLKDGKLLVGHDAGELRPDRTLRAMYLDPLRARAKQNGGRVFSDAPAPLTLLVDIKTDGLATYRVLRDVLADYDDLLAGPVRARKQTAELSGNSTNEPRQPAVVVVVSGNRPKQAIEQDKDRRVGIDGRIGDLESDAPADLVPLISDNWRNHFRWRGEGSMPEAEQAKLRSFVAQAHTKGRRLRFWATPEKEAVWKELQDAGVDLIGTDDLTRLAEFLRKN